MANINFYNVDCIDFMKSVPDKHYDLAIVDPPYGISINISMGRRKGDKKSEYTKFHGEDKSIPKAEYFEQLFRVSKNQIVWGGNYMTNHLPQSKCWICWDKELPEGLSFSDFELAWTSYDKAAKKVRIKQQGFIGLKGKRIHPTQKPVQLYRWQLKEYATCGMKILDTHGGSMTNAIACDIEGFDLDICELDKHYFDLGVKAFNLHKSQTRLF